MSCKSKHFILKRLIASVRELLLIKNKHQERNNMKHRIGHVNSFSTVICLCSPVSVKDRWRTANLKPLQSLFLLYKAGVSGVRSSTTFWLSDWRKTMDFWERRWLFAIYMGKPGSSRFRANGKQHSLGLVNSFCSRVYHWDLWASLKSPFPGRGAKHTSKETKQTRGRPYLFSQNSIFFIHITNSQVLYHWRKLFQTW